MRVVVAHAPAGGPTADIAERIALRLSRGTIAAVATALPRVHELASYDAVVLGSILRDSGWLPEALQYVRQHAALLRTKPVWVYSVARSNAMRRSAGATALLTAPRIAADLVAHVQPRGDRLFSGVVTTNEARLANRLFFTLMGGHHDSFRKWPEIEAWADTIAEELSLGIAASG